jgi:hypothetical protein
VSGLYLTLPINQNNNPDTFSRSQRQNESGLYDTFFTKRSFISCQNYEYESQPTAKSGRRYGFQGSGWICDF